MKEGIIETLNVIPAGVVIIDSKENKVKFINDDLINLLATDQLEKPEMT